MSEVADPPFDREQEIREREKEARNLNTKLRALQLEVARTTIEITLNHIKLLELQEPEPDTVAVSDQSSSEICQNALEMVLCVSDPFKLAVNKMVRLAECYKLELDSAMNKMGQISDDEREEASASIAKRRSDVIKYQQAVVSRNYDACDESTTAGAEVDLFIDGEDFTNAIKAFLTSWTLDIDKKMTPFAMYMKIMSTPEDACPEWIQSAAAKLTADNYDRDSLGYFGHSIIIITELPQLNYAQALFVLRGIDVLYSILKPKRRYHAISLIQKYMYKQVPGVLTSALLNYLLCTRHGDTRSRGQHLLNFAPAYSIELQPGVKLFNDGQRTILARSRAPIRYFHPCYVHSIDLPEQRIIRYKIDGYRGPGTIAIWEIPMQNDGTDLGQLSFEMRNYEDYTNDLMRLYKNSLNIGWEVLMPTAQRKVLDYERHYTA